MKKLNNELKTHWRVTLTTLTLVRTTLHEFCPSKIPQNIPIVKFVKTDPPRNSNRKKICHPAN